MQTMRERVDGDFFAPRDRAVEPVVRRDLHVF
jgi:hypothetical protein